MGKRELVLIALFAAIGIVVYQFTAPPPPPGSEGVSVGGIFHKLKRGVQGAREVATADSRQTAAVDEEVRLVRINFPRSSDVTITGSDRADIAVELRASARGFDQAEAKAAADAAKLTLEHAGDAIVIGAALPSGRGGPGSGFINEATITIGLPRRLLVRIEPHVGQLIVRDVAGLEAMGSRGETHVSGSAGHVILTHSGGPLEVDGVPSLKLTARNSHGSIKHVAGTLSLDATGAELDLEDIAGPVDIETRNSELEIDATKTVKVPVRFNGTGGRLRVKGLRAEARIDGRNVEMEVSMEAAAPVTIYSTGEDIAVNAPPGGYTLDAVATEGHVSIDDGTLKPPDDAEQRVTGAVRGGGPPLTLRATRADIRVRKLEGK